MTNRLLDNQLVDSFTFSNHSPITVRLVNYPVAMPPCNANDGLGDCACIGSSTVSPDELADLEFANRVLEKEWLLNPASPPLKAIDAPAGYGKTRLIEEVAKEYRGMGWSTAVVELRSDLDDPLDILDEIAKQVSQQFLKARRGESKVVQGLLRVLAGNNIFLCFDCAEANKEYVDWLRTQIVPELDKGLRGISLRVVFAGRGLSRTSIWNWEGYEIRKLSPFDWFTVQEMLQRVGRNDRYARNLQLKDYREMALAIHRLSGGHPGAIIELVRTVVANRWTLTFSEEQCSDLFDTCVENAFTELVKDYEISDSEMKTVSSLLIFRGVNTSTVKCLIEEELITEDDPLQLIARLKHLGILSERKGGEIFYRDSIVRGMILSHMRIKNKSRFQKLHRVACNVYHKWVPIVVRAPQHSSFVPRNQLLEVITTESFYHALHLGDPQIIKEELKYHVRHSPKQRILDWLAKDDEIYTCVQEIFGKAIEELLKQSSEDIHNIRVKGGASMNTEELIELQAKAQELSLRLEEIDSEHEDGMLQTPDWTKMKTTLGTKRRVLLSEIQGVLRGTEAEDLVPIIDQVVEGVPEKQVKKELRTTVERKGWGKVVVDKISEHKGEIVSLITLVAIEVGKRLR